MELYNLSKNFINRNLWDCFQQGDIFSIYRYHQYYWRNSKVGLENISKLNHCGLFKLFMTTHPYILNHNLMGALYSACRIGNIKIAREILRNKRTNLRQVYIQYAIYNASKSGNLEMFNEMIKVHKSSRNIEHDADVNLDMIPDVSILYGAAKSGSLDMVNRVIELGSRDYACGFLGACQGGNLDIVKIMTKLDSSCMTQGIISACKCGHLEIVKYFIDSGHFNYHLMLRYACESPNPELINFILGLGEPPRETEYLNSCLRDICRSGHYDIALKFIELGADDFRGGFIKACAGGHDSIVNLLIDDAYIADGLIEACEHNHVSMVKMLAPRCEIPDSAMYRALKHDYYDIVVILILNGLVITKPMIDFALQYSGTAISNYLAQHR